MMSLKEIEEKQKGRTFRFRAEGGTLVIMAVLGKIEGRKFNEVVSDALRSLEWIILEQAKDRIVISLPKELYKSAFEINDDSEVVEIGRFIKDEALAKEFLEKHMKEFSEKAVVEEEPSHGVS